MRAVPWGLVGMLVLVLPAEWYVSRRAFDVLTPSDWSYQRKDWCASHEGRRYGVLCFGDSLVSFGVMPRAVAERSGRATYNLALPGSQAPSSYLLLRRVIDSGARPEGVIVDFFPTLLRVGPRHNLSGWASLVGPAGAAELAWLARDPGLFGIISVGRLVPSVRAREGLRDGIMVLLKQRRSVRTPMNRVIARNWDRNDGAQMMPASPGSLAVTADQYELLRKGFYPDLTCEPVNAAYIRKFLALAAAHGVTVYWVLPPVAPGLRSVLARSGFNAEHEAFVRSWQARFPRLIVVDGRGAIADPLGYFDPNHLSDRGAYAFSLALGDTLRRTLPDRGGWWVVLPTRPIGAVPAGVEDIQQSKLALEANAKVRR